MGSLTIFLGIGGSVSGNFGEAIGRGFACAGKQGRVHKKSRRGGTLGLSDF
jgi:hypothetical protein